MLYLDRITHARYVAEGDSEMRTAEILFEYSSTATRQKFRAKTFFLSFFFSFFLCAIQRLTTSSVALYIYLYVYAFITLKVSLDSIYTYMHLCRLVYERCDMI